MDISLNPVIKITLENIVSWDGATGR